MANLEHLKILKQGIDAWNQWRKENPTVTPDLSEAKISDTNFHLRIPPEIADLGSIDFSDTILFRSILKSANLRNANLQGANLKLADLRKADLRGADLRRAELNQANLTLANLSEAKLHNALFWETVLARVNLRNASGLDSSRHGGPSIIDHRTLRRSGRLPISFLHGIGLTDELIHILTSSHLRLEQFYSCFISYSRQDETFAKKLHKSLLNNGVPCWFAPHDIRGGQKLHEQILTNIESHDRLLLILSKHSMSSNWVSTEIAKARQLEEGEGRRVLFPISLVRFEEIKAWSCFDADIGKDSAREIREYFIPDFSEWKNNQKYREAFARLLKDLRAN